MDQMIAPKIRWKKSRSFEIVTDTYNLLHGHVSAVLSISISFAQKKKELKVVFLLNNLK